MKILTQKFEFCVMHGELVLNHFFSYKKRGLVVLLTANVTHKNRVHIISAKQLPNSHDEARSVTT